MNIEDMVTFEVNGKKYVAFVRKLTERHRISRGHEIRVQEEPVAKLRNAGMVVGVSEFEASGHNKTLLHRGVVIERLKNPETSVGY